MSRQYLSQVNIFGLRFTSQGSKVAVHEIGSCNWLKPQILSIGVTIIQGSTGLVALEINVTVVPCDIGPSGAIVVCDFRRSGLSLVGNGQGLP